MTLVSGHDGGADRTEDGATWREPSRVGDGAHGDLTLSPRVARWPLVTFR